VAAAAACALPAAAGAQTHAVTTFLVTTLGASGAGNTAVDETLSIDRGASGSRLRLAGNDGSVLSVPAVITTQGEIASDSQDGAVTCYNMAVDAAAHVRRADAAAPPSVFVRFGNSVVQIPLVVAGVQKRGTIRTTALNGTSAGFYSGAGAPVDAGIIIAATVEEEDGELHAAVFDERHYIGTPANVVGRSTCVLRRAATPSVTPA
jgi:hypothetical protein